MSPHTQPSSVMPPPPLPLPLIPFSTSPPLSPSSSPPSPLRNLPSSTKSNNSDSPLPQRSLSIKRSMSLASLHSDHPLKSRKSKTASLFQLFSRPNVEKQRGYTEQNILPPLFEPSVAPSHPAAHPFQSHAAENTTSNRPATSRAVTTPSRLDHVSFEPPPLFQAYSRATKYASLEAPDQSHVAPVDHRTHRLKQMASINGLRKRQSMDFASLTGTKSKRDPIVRAQSSLSQDSNYGSRKVYVLADAGYLLEYAGDGPFDRMPEAILKLEKESNAFASELIPGKPWVLQVVQKPAVADPAVRTLRSRNSFFFKKQKPDTSRSASSLSLVCESSAELDEWLTAIRKAIEFVGGKDSHEQPSDFAPELVTPPRTLPRRLSRDSNRSSVSSYTTTPTMTVGSRTSMNAFVGTASRSGQRITSLEFSDPPRLSFYARSDDSHSILPELPTFDIRPPVESFAALSVTSSPHMLGPDIYDKNELQHHDTVRVSSAWDASLRQDAYPASDYSPQSPENWPLQQHYLTAPKGSITTKASTTPSSPTRGPRRQLRQQHSEAALTSPTIHRSPSTGTGARLSLYPLPLRVAVTPEAFALACRDRARSRSPISTLPSSSPALKSPTSPTPSHLPRGNPNPTSTLRRPSSMPVTTDLTPFLSRNRSRMPATPTVIPGRYSADGVAGLVSVDGVLVSKSALIAAGRARRRRSAGVPAPLLLGRHLPPPTPPPTRPLPMIPTAAAAAASVKVART